MGSKAAGFKEKPDTVPLKQACAAIGQARLMMIYQKFFAEYNQVTAQVLMTRNTMPVSYTHLDVYKRQFLGLSACGGNPGGVPGALSGL